MNMKLNATLKQKNRNKIMQKNAHLGSSIKMSKSKLKDGGMLKISTTLTLTSFCESEWKFNFLFMFSCIYFNLFCICNFVHTLVIF